MTADLSLRSLFTYAGSFLSQFTGGPSHVGDFYEPSSGAPMCPIDGPLSCHNSTPFTGDACCFVHPGGRILLTQFWDRHAYAPGAETDWTLHGLWYVWKTTNIGGCIRHMPRRSQEQLTVASRIKQAGPLRWHI